ncbi:polyketide synthase dehydratase domain-containing protein [Steroidobacter cummioxidans]|uniref:polyketide synthase dehydratase domain-containing protein n=1 Tax=Steroidobacter cummioxidans TaxID=1803913 RepID=UPI000E31F753|nr:polyketide synthase dehydratase domain-containing protein [Steroidobacter cummioxidans]
MKSNVGHCLAAAGIAGFIKIVLALRHRQLPPTVNFDRLNEHIALADTPFYVNDRLQAWEVADTDRRRAAISAFGFSGTNAHVVVAEPLAREEVRKSAAPRTDGNGVVVPLSARMPEQLEQKARELLDFIRNAEDPIDLVDLAYTLQVGREAMEERLGFLVSSIAQLTEKLDAFLSGARESEGVHRGQMQDAKDSLSIFAQDADMRDAIVDRCIAQRQLGKLLSLWAKGLDLDWRKLYGEIKPKRIRLPLYPFAKQRYWIDSSSATQTATTSTALHPLLHTNTSDFTAQSYRSKFTGTETFLRDHRVKLGGRGVQKVLPGVAYLEMARAAIQHAAPAQAKSPVLEISEFVWLKPLVVTEPKEVSIALSRNDQDANINYEIFSEDAAGRSVHCQGFAAYKPLSATPRLDLDQLKGQMTRGAVDCDALYGMFDVMGLQYGSAHRGITSLHLGNHQLLAQLRLPECVLQGSAAFQLHPSLMDSALQACAGLIVDFAQPPGEPLVPFALASLQVFSACTEEMFAWLRYSSGSRPEDKVIRLDIDVCDRHGSVCVQMQGFSARVAESAASFDSAFYGRLLERIMTGEVSAMDAAELG